MRDIDADMTFGTGVAGVRNGSDAADDADRMLEKIYDEHALALFRYAFALTGSADDAEDAVQEVFARIARDKQRLQDIEHIKPYLFASARNAAFGILRSRRRKDVLECSVSSHLLTQVCEDAFGHIAESAAVCKAFADLPADQREILVLKVFDEMSFKEIADTIGVSINTAASRYRYALDKLRQALGENDNG